MRLKITFSSRGSFKVGTIRTDNGGEFMSQALHKFLGLDVNQISDSISLGLEDYIVKAANSIFLRLIKPRYISISPTVDLFDISSLLLKNDTSYQSLIGQLLFADNNGRPDIEHPASLLSRFFKAPTELHHQTSQCVLQYLYTSRHVCLMYQICSPVQINIYSDASYRAHEDSTYATRSILPN